jgi:hypothetical protein
MFILRLDHDTREAFNNFVKFSSKKDRFDNIYDGWIDKVEDELIVLDIYSVILRTIKTLDAICITDKEYRDYLDSKKTMLLLLLKNKQYQNASNLLSINMYNEAFKVKAIDDLRKKVLEYLIKKELPLPNKLIVELYEWISKRKLPSYMISDIDNEFKYEINDYPISSTTLEEDIVEELKKPRMTLEKIVNNLVIK